MGTLKHEKGKQVTRDIDFNTALDLLKRVPRACLAYASQQGAFNQPVVLRWHEQRYLVALPANVNHIPITGREAVLLVDEGLYYFELRAFYLRGQIMTVEHPPVEAPGKIWYELVPIKIVAWDYGRMRSVVNES